MPLYKRSNSPFWWVRIGRKTRESTRTANREDAEEYERALRKRLWRLEELGDRGAVSWKEAAGEWLDSSARDKKRDRWILTWLEKRIGDAQMREVDSDALEELRKDGLTDGWSHSTIDRMMGTVSAVLKYCVSRDMLDKAPAIPMYRPATDEPRFLTHAEFHRLCSHLPMHLVLAAKVAVFTLLRMRAMLQLEWARVDLYERRAWIPRAHQKGGRTFGFALNEPTVIALRMLRWLSPPTSPHVFVWNGRRIDDCNTLAFKTASWKAGLTGLRWHDLRHTGASWAVQNGVTLQELMQLGDWRDYRSVLRYAHLAPSQTARAAELVAHGVAHSMSAQKPANAAKRRKKLVERKGIEPSTFALRRLGS